MSPSDPPVDKTSTPDAPDVTQHRFWVGPLVAGCCFALGYGITGRVLKLQTNPEDPAPQAFAPLAFPGDSLQEIRARFSDGDADLQVDVTALEAAEASTRSDKPEVKTTIKPDLALQTPQPPVWTAPDWSDPQTIAPDLESELEPGVSEADRSAPSTVQEQELDDGSTEPLVTPEPSEVVPAVVVPADDSPVLLAEPDSAVVPPGAEAFFETIEPVIPPQP